MTILYFRDSTGNREAVVFTEDDAVSDEDLAPYGMTLVARAYADLYFSVGHEAMLPTDEPLYPQN